MKIWKTPELYDKAKLEAKHLVDIADDNKVTKNIKTKAWKRPWMSFRDIKIKFAVNYCGRFHQPWLQLPPYGKSNLKTYSLYDSDWSCDWVGWCVRLVTEMLPTWWFKPRNSSNKVTQFSKSHVNNSSSLVKWRNCPNSNSGFSHSVVQCSGPFWKELTGCTPWRFEGWTR